MVAIKLIRISSQEFSVLKTICNMRFEKRSIDTSRRLMETGVIGSKNKPDFFIVKFDKTR
jgi:hypothetical protein